MNQFLSVIKDQASQKENYVLDYVITNLIEPQNKDKRKEESKGNNIVNNFNEIKNKLGELLTKNERECNKRINEFVVDFEENIQVLLSLANLIEEKTIFEIEKLKNTIMLTLKSETLDPKIKLEIIGEKMNSLSEIIQETFESMVDKIKAYQDMSDKKIGRAKDSFLIKIKKFLN